MTDRLADTLAALEEAAREVDAGEVPALVTRLGAVLAVAGARLVSGGERAGDETPEKLFTLEEAAAFLGKSPKWLRQKAAAGSIPCAQRIGRSWRFPAADFRRYVVRMRQVG